MSQSANVKTISRLEPANNLDKGDLFWISQKEGESYSSKRTTLDQIILTAGHEISTFMKDHYKMGDVDIGQLSGQVDNIFHGDTTFEGQKTFQIRPKIQTTSNTGTPTDDQFTTSKDVKDIVDNSQMFIGPNSKTDKNPENDSRTTSENVDCKWFIPNGKTDSTERVEEIADIPPDMECGNSGHLVVYGWGADAGGILPVDAWVAIYGKIKYGNQRNEAWTILQLQPWNVSDRSKVFQYVSFNIPVKKGLELKIKTGFKMNFTATATNQSNSLALDQVRSNGGTFIGYIIGD